ncbi:MAG: YbaB/EbfC family nucleoid-associated protein [Nitrospirota bacterium]
MFNPKQLMDLMRQAQSIQEKMAQVREELGRRTVEASAGGGMVTVVVNGQQEVVSVKIEPEMLTGSDQTVLQELIRAAVNDGLRKSKAMMAEAMKELTGGMPLPPGLLS